MARRKKLPLPVGVSDYKRLQEYYSVDKTEMIADILDAKIQISLFARPRRFGKTLNMSMLRTFFEKTDEDNSVYFKDKKIWQLGDEYKAEQGKYPVIFLSFKDIKSKTFAQAMESISLLIWEEFDRNLVACENLNNENLQYYKSVHSRKASQSENEASLKMLTKFLHDYYGAPAIIMIDEYDIPLQTAYMNGYYDEIISFMRAFLSAGLKDNSNIKYGFLTGITRVAKESIFSGLNNLRVYSILDKKFSQYFGFTQQEINEMAAYYEATDKLPEIKQWYDGYVFGEKEIYNPWSVVSYFENYCMPGAYWGSTSSNDLLKELIKNADSVITEKLNKLYEGEEVFEKIEPHISYSDLKSRPSLIFSFLAICGYTKYDNVK